jgi:hypothetical protein
MWQEYTYSAPLLVDGKDILDILDREDDLLSKNVSTLTLFDWLFPLYTACDKWVLNLQNFIKTKK